MHTVYYFFFKVGFVIKFCFFPTFEPMTIYNTSCVSLSRCKIKSLLLEFIYTFDLMVISPKLNCLHLVVLATSINAAAFSFFFFLSPLDARLDQYLQKEKVTNLVKA